MEQVLIIFKECGSYKIFHNCTSPLDIIDVDKVYVSFVNTEKTIDSWNKIRPNKNDYELMEHFTNYAIIALINKLLDNYPHYVPINKLMKKSLNVKVIGDKEMEYKMYNLHHPLKILDHPK